MWVLLSVSVTNETSPCAKFASHVKLDGRVNTAKAPTRKMHRNYISTKCKILPEKVGKGGGNGEVQNSFECFGLQTLRTFYL